MGVQRLEQQVFGDLGKGSTEEEILRMSKHLAGGWSEGVSILAEEIACRQVIMRLLMERSVVLWEQGFIHGESLKHADILEG